MTITTPPAHPVKKGFACLSQRKRKDIARLGGLAVKKNNGIRYFKKLGARGGVASGRARASH